MRVDPRKIQIDSCSKLLKIDSVILCKIVRLPDGNRAIQVKDGNRLRAGARGSEFLEIPLDDLIAVIQAFDFECLNEIR